MKNIKNFKKYNESILGDIQRLNPVRRDSDQKGRNLFNDIKKDYLENGEDLRKVNIIDGFGNKISLDSVEIGKEYSLSYVFGKYHPLLRSNHSGNKKAGDRRIKITSLPFSFTIRKNELEKAFNTSRIKLPDVKVTDIKTKHNYNRNPNIGKNALFIEDKENYKVSSDVANVIFNFFINEIVVKYPQLSKSRYKGEMSIRDIQKGMNPTIKYLHIKSKDGKDITVDIKYGENERDIINMVSNMTEHEYNKYSKSKKEEAYKKSNEVSINNKKVIENKLDKFFKSIGVDLSSNIDEFNKYGFRMGGFLDGYEFIVEFRYKQNLATDAPVLILEGIQGAKWNEVTDVYFPYTFSQEECEAIEGQMEDQIDWEDIIDYLNNWNNRD